MAVLKIWEKNLETKKAIRKEFLFKRNSFPEKLRKEYSKLIEDRLLSLEQYKKADTVLIYADYGSEVSTRGVMEHALRHSKRVFCPKVLAPGIMEFYEIFSLQELICGYKNIPEPSNIDNLYRYPNNEKALMIMPLVAYDSTGMRLGYGGGFYDRYLEKHSFSGKIALGYECQKYERILPTEETDIRPDMIITETNCYSEF